ncbi:MAG: PilZ domain-containing protein [Bdellovibrionales bacterium]|nr:PilZ domain-containing protein [Bdellovibrionales bacterium]
MNMSREYIKRRRVPRREFKKKVGLLIGGNYHVNVAVQIGEGGLMTHSLDPLQKGQRLVVAFRLPGKQETVVRAIVRYIIEDNGPFGNKYGVEFENLEFRVRREIRNYVASKSEAEYKRSG